MIFVFHVSLIQKAACFCLLRPPHDTITCMNVISHVDSSTGASRMAGQSHSGVRSSASAIVWSRMGVAMCCDASS